MINNVVIFEGQDRCLKSTMIDRLIRTDSLHNYHTIHYGKPPKIDTVQQYQEKTYSQMFELLSENMDFILDRSHLGEMIWSPIYRKYDAKPFIQNVEKKWYQANKNEKNIFLFILVDSNFEKWSKRDDLQGLNNGNATKHLEEISYFKESLNYTCIERKFFYDLSTWYKDGSDRLDDVALFNQIYNVISTAS